MKALAVILIPAILAPVPGTAGPSPRQAEMTATVLCRDGTGTAEDRVTNCRSALTEFRHTRAARARILSRLGAALSDTGRNPEAVETLLRATRLMPDLAEAHRNLGWAYWTMDRYRSAQDAFNLAFSLSASAESLAGFASSIARGTADPDRALAYLQQVYRIDPDYAWPVVEEGWLHHRQDRWADALAAFDRALEIDDAYASAHDGRARSLFRLGRADDALGAINAALAARPDSVRYLAYRAYLHRMAGRYLRAVADGRRAVAVSPDNATAVVALAHALQAAGRSAEARDIFAAAETRGMAYPFFLYHYAEFLSDEQDWTGAIDRVDRILGGGTGDKFDYNLKAYLSLQVDNFPEALDAADAALEQDGAYAPALYNRALALALGGRPMSAFEALVRARRAGMDDDDLSDFLATLTENRQYVLVSLIRLRLDSTADRAANRAGTR